MAAANQTVTIDPPEDRTSVWAALLPLMLGAGILAIVFGVGTGNILPTTVPPAEDLFVGEPVVTEAGFEVPVVNNGGVPLTIAQVLVDDAYWDHSVTPSRELDPLDRATVIIPYPWVEGEANAIAIVTHTGTPFETEVPLAIATPTPTAKTFLDFTWVGILVGVLPVALGMSFLPMLRRSDARVERFVLALTIGLLAFLAFDGFEEGLEFAHDVAPIYNPVGLLLLTAAAAFLIVYGLERWSARMRPGRRGVTIAWMVALGIGIHNMGEGLAIGASWAAGSVAFSTFLVLGFTLHNVTEGPAIVAPATHDRVRWQTWLGMLALAGLPTVLGGWIGGTAPDPMFLLGAFGLGLGAIAVVAVQVAGHMRRESPGAMSRPEVLAGLLAGFGIMWATGLLVAL